MSLTNDEKDKIYDWLYDNRIKFIGNIKKENRILNINKLLKLVNDIQFNSFEECFSVLTNHWDKKCLNPTCKKDRKLLNSFPNRNDYNFIKKKYGIFKFCDDKTCNYKSISERQSGDKNTCHRMTTDSFNSMCLKNSISMKSKIRNGEFIPNITNSWARSRCDIFIYRNGEKINLKTRSTWEAYFQIFNPYLLYEKITIPYIHNNESHNYIVDFVDFVNKIIYEIKPKATYHNIVNLSKYKYAKKWCRTNGYKYIIIKDSWFKKNYNSNIVIGQPSEEKIIKNLKQFNENKKYKKNKL